MSATPGTAPPPEWFLARDGEQFGPLNDSELRKLVEFGHLKSSDLLWREGFPDWRSARILLEDKALIGGVSPAVSPATAPAPAAAPSSAQTAAATAAAAAAAGAAALDPSAVVPSSPAQASPQTQRASAYPQPYAQHPSASQIQPGPLQSGLAPTPMNYPAQAGGGHQMSAGGQPSANPQSAAGAYAPARPVDLARPAAAAPVATATRHAGAAPVHRQDGDDEEDFDEPEERSRVVVWIKRIAVLVFFSLTLAAAAWYLYPFRDRLLKALDVSSLNSLGFGASASPVAGFKPTTEATDEALQATALWKVLKRDFPEWYGERVKEASALAKAEKGDAEIGKEMVQAVIALRRKHAGDALSATTPKLKTLASSFADNLVRLRKVSVGACHGFISTGETSPDYLRLLSDPKHSSALQAQLVAVFEAIADGRKVPRIYPQPKQADYNLLVTALEGRGWTESDMQLFSDSRRFGQAEPDKVCKMVTDWFQAQIEMTDPDAQLRLLADALKPVVAG
jgi:hypothetical protein